jgi:hypothetical protein
MSNYFAIQVANIANRQTSRTMHRNIDCEKNFKRTICEKTRSIIETLIAIIYNEPSYKLVKVSVTRKQLREVNTRTTIFLAKEYKGKRKSHTLVVYKY